MPQRIPDGIVTVLNTPFDESGGIDDDAVRANVAYALDAGVAGFLVPAMASEVSKLTESERHRLVATVLDAVNGRAPVIGGASHPDALVRERIARSLIDAGCDGVLVSIAYETDDAYATAVRRLAELEPPFLMLQDWDPTGDGLPIPLIIRLYEEGLFQSLKVEVVPAGPKYSTVSQATGGGLHLAGGWAVSQMIDALDRGVDAIMPTAMHRTYVRIHNLYQRGDRPGALALFERLLPVLAFANQHLDISIHFFKRLLYAQGIFRTPLVRLPILPFDVVHEQHAARLIELAMELEQENEKPAR
ncbi:MAG: dihydrodipicolinate synthase family protein [Candidatus Limnocylindrales bacterium]